MKMRRFNVQTLLRIRRTGPSRDAVRTPGPHGPLPTPGPQRPPGQLAPPDDSSLTGIWRADDGGMYFLRQIGNAVRWVGLSQVDSFYPGLHFCNVYHAKVTGQVVSGEWSDVPRGATSNRGQMTLTFVDGNPQLLLRNSATGGFSASRWWRIVSSPWRPVLAGSLFPDTLKNVQKVEFFGIGGGYETLEYNLQLIRDAASVFGTVTTGEDHTEHALIANYPPDQGRSYRDFICLNDDVTFLGTGGWQDQQDGDVTFYFLVDRDQINERQPNFFAGVDHPAQVEAEAKMPSIHGEIIMYGRAVGCEDGAETAPPLFPGWAEQAGNSVLFNGAPIPEVFPTPGAGSGHHAFLSELSFGDPVRVTGAMVIDIRHPERLLEIHPVYSVDKITATFSRDLSGGWADDVGNTYYLRHDLADNTVWYAGLSPIGEAMFGQVFRGTFHPAPVVIDDSAVPEGIGIPELPWDTLTGNVTAISFGFGTAPLFGSSLPRLEDTSQVAFELSRAKLAGRDVPALITGDFRLMKLYDAPPRGVSA